MGSNNSISADARKIVRAKTILYDEHPGISDVYDYDGNLAVSDTNGELSVIEFNTHDQYKGSVLVLGLREIVKCEKAFIENNVVYMVNSEGAVSKGQAGESPSVIFQTNGDKIVEFKYQNNHLILRGKKTIWILRTNGHLETTVVSEVKQVQVNIYEILYYLIGNTLVSENSCIKYVVDFEILGHKFLYHTEDSTVLLDIIANKVYNVYKVYKVYKGLWSWLIATDGQSYLYQFKRGRVTVMMSSGLVLHCNISNQKTTPTIRNYNGCVYINYLWDSLVYVVDIVDKKLSITIIKVPQYCRNIRLYEKSILCDNKLWQLRTNDEVRKEIGVVNTFNGSFQLPAILSAEEVFLAAKAKYEASCPDAPRYYTKLVSLQPLESSPSAPGEEGSQESAPGEEVIPGEVEMCYDFPKVPEGPPGGLPFYDFPKVPKKRLSLEEPLV